MFRCKHDELTELHQTFSTKLHAELPGLAGQYTEPSLFFRAFLPRREVARLLAKLACDILKIYDSVPMLLVNDPTIQS
jgi:hypothetical protein